VNNQIIHALNEKGKYEIEIAQKGQQFLYQEVKKYLSPEGLTFADNYIGFPNAAVDRIVPAQSHEDSLFVVVEPFNEWVVETKRLKNPDLRLKDVHY
ncbi:mannitol dehydrogenase family protein, partial [Streptococcus pneumoniae]